MHPLAGILRAIPPADLAMLLPPSIALRAARLAVAGERIPPVPATPADRDPAFLGQLMPAFRWLADHWFRWQCHGVANVPREGPVLMVGNHSGGLMIFDGILAMLALWEDQGPDRAMHPLAHWFVHRDEVVRRYALKAGAMPASPESAHAILQAGGIAAVYPGSDRDVFRPFRDRNRVVLGGRSGFVKVALRERVPLVPVVTTGAHEQFIVLTTGEGVARLLGLRRRVKTNLMPLVLSVPWGLTLGIMPYLPLPTQITTDFLPPFRWPDLPPEAADDPEVVANCYREVESAMQAAMDRRAAGRIPWLGQL
jgi:1-acyl-sn-glycerol-3-phosphate acyltransferase